MTLSFLCGLTPNQRFMFAVLAGAVAKKTLTPDTLPLFFKSVPILKDIAPVLLSHPEIVAGITAEVACEPQEAYDSVAKYVKAGVAGYAGGMFVEKYMLGVSNKTNI